MRRIMPTMMRWTVSRFSSLSLSLARSLALALALALSRSLAHSLSRSHSLALSLSLAHPHSRSLALALNCCSATEAKGAGQVHGCANRGRPVWGIEHWSHRSTGCAGAPCVSCVPPRARTQAPSAPRSTPFRANVTPEDFGSVCLSWSASVPDPRHTGGTSHQETHDTGAC